MDFPKLWSFLKGKKTYIVTVAMLIVAFLRGPEVDTNLILEALGLAGLRNGIK